MGETGDRMSTRRASAGGDRLPFRSILVATDLSDGSEAIVRAAAEVAVLSGGALHVVHAAEVLAEPRAGTSGSVADRVAQASVEVRDLVSRVVPHAVAVDHHVGSSAPDQVIMEHTLRVDADLIVVGPHVRRTGSGWLLGSTAQKVLSTSAVPCLVVRAPVVAPSRHVIAAVNPSHRVDPVLDLAIRWALLFSGGEDTRRPPRLSALYISPDRSASVPPELERSLRSALTRGGASDRMDAEVAVRGTDVVESILLYAEAEVGDLLVLSTRNHGVLGRTLFGSVSAEVTRRAPCNVLLVPPEAES